MPQHTITYVCEPANWLFCPVYGCSQKFCSWGGQTKHLCSKHNKNEIHGKEPSIMQPVLQPRTRKMESSSPAAGTVMMSRVDLCAWKSPKADSFTSLWHQYHIALSTRSHWRWDKTHYTASRINSASNLWSITSVSHLFQPSPFPVLNNTCLFCFFHCFQSSGS